MEKVLQFVETMPDGGLPDLLKDLIRATPDDGIVDWKLMLRDPQPRVASESGRVVQVGDSAHTFLPSSGDGANQAMEDAISLASCLHVGGKSNIGWAVKIHNKLRYASPVLLSHRYSMSSCSSRKRLLPSHPRSDSVGRR